MYYGREGGREENMIEWDLEEILTGREEGRATVGNSKY